jgi:hypothetical protein
MLSAILSQLEAGRELSREETAVVPGLANIILGRLDRNRIS